MPYTFCRTEFRGPVGSALRPIVRELSSSHPASLASAFPWAHPGSINPEWTPRIGTFQPNIPPGKILTPNFNPANTPRGLGWGFLVGLAGAWVDWQIKRYRDGLDWRGQPYPQTAEEDVGQILEAVVFGCAKTDEDIKLALALDAMPARAQKKDPQEEKGVKRWRIFARTRAAKRKRQA